MWLFRSVRLPREGMLARRETLDLEATPSEQCHHRKTPRDGKKLFRPQNSQDRDLLKRTFVENNPA